MNQINSGYGNQDPGFVHMKKLLFSLAFVIVFSAACQPAPPTTPAMDSTATPLAQALETLIPVPSTLTPTPEPTSTPTTTPTMTSPTRTLIPPTETAQLSIDDRVASIQTYLEGQAASGYFSGSVLIAEQGTPASAQAFGLADRGLNLPNQIDTKFNLGSMDKMFTGVAIMQLVERGVLSLEGKVGEYLTDYPNPEVADLVTIHQLLTHTSGMGNYFDSTLYIDTHDQIRSLDDYLALFANTPLQFQPGAQFAYSNSGYIVLGLIIEAVSGQSYYDYVDEHIFDLAGMDATASYEYNAGTPNLAVGYTTLDWEGNDTGQITDNTSMLPLRGGSAGGGYSTAPDLLAFSSALLNYQLLSPESTELLIKGKIQMRNEAQYAYGFMDRIVHGHRQVGHGGGFPGICSLLSIYPDLDITVVVLSNSDYDCLVVDEYIDAALLK